MELTWWMPSSFISCLIPITARVETRALVRHPGRQDHREALLLRLTGGVEVGGGRLVVAPESVASGRDLVLVVVLNTFQRRLELGIHALHVCPHLCHRHPNA